MKNLSNNNNKLNIMNKIKDVQKQLNNLTNNLEKFESEQNVLVNKYYTLLIDDRERFVKQHQNLYILYDKKALEDKNNRKEYIKN
jgi:hypothetical protein